MSDFHTTRDAVTASIKALRSAAEAWGGRVDTYHFDTYHHYAETLFARFCPFQVGDRVRLMVTPTITAEQSWGWLPSKHFLVAGLTGTVKSIDLYKGKFGAGVEWDGQTYLSYPDNKPTPRDRPKIYWHNEDDIARVEAGQ